MKCRSHYDRGQVPRRKGPSFQEKMAGPWRKLILQTWRKRCRGLFSVRPGGTVFGLEGARPLSWSVGAPPDWLLGISKFVLVQQSHFGRGRSDLERRASQHDEPEPLCHRRLGFTGHETKVEQGRARYYFRDVSGPKPILKFDYDRGRSPRRKGQVKLQGRKFY